MNNKRRSQRMENAALLLGVIGAATFCLVYPALICGSLAIVFYTFAIAELYYGGVENMARQVYGTLGIDFDTLMNSLGQ